LDTPEYVESENIFKIGHRSSAHQLFSKREYFFLNVKLTDFKTFLGYYYVFQVVEHMRTVLERLHLENKIFQKN
jgi:hypothetical protein